MMDGKGRFIYADGAVFDGVMRADEKHGIATYRWAGDGAVGVIQYRGGAPVGEGVRWSADRRTFVRSFDPFFVPLFVSLVPFTCLLV